MTAPIPPAPSPAPGAPPRWHLLTDGDDGTILLSVAEFDTPFLLTASLSQGLGSSALTLDRGTAGPDRIAVFHRAAGRVLLLVRNKHHRAGGAADAARAGEENFAGSVLWSGPVLREDGPAAVVDITALALTDLHGIAAQLRDRGQGDYTVDPAASCAPAPGTVPSGGPHGIRLPALLTLRGRATGEAVRSLAPLPPLSAWSSGWNCCRCPRNRCPPAPTTRRPAATAPATATTAPPSPAPWCATSHGSGWPRPTAPRAPSSSSSTRPSPTRCAPPSSRAATGGRRPSTRRACPARSGWRPRRAAWI
ncbi:hypothetical protein ACFV5N_13985 [Streptomyces sp. NPDC059853]|uniref:hypothetical protein n=1 Tax=Streptomyces sp. NPDC059853 TaxID=3346973 RepID=UPI003655ED98